MDLVFDKFKHGQSVIGRCITALTLIRIGLVWQFNHEESLGQSD